MTCRLLMTRIAFESQVRYHRRSSGHVREECFVSEQLSSRAETYCYQGVGFTIERG